MAFGQIKARARRAVHTVMAVPCDYLAPGARLAVRITARLHTRIMVGGDGGNAGYATVIEGVTKIVFNREQLTALGVTLRANGRVTFLDYAYADQGSTFVLDTRDTISGPVTEKWSVAAS